MLSLPYPNVSPSKAARTPSCPTVIIGNAVLTESGLKIALTLKSHELIKIRVMSGDRALRETVLDSICTQLDAAQVQHIGKIW